MGASGNGRQRPAKNPKADPCAQKCLAAHGSAAARSAFSRIVPRLSWPVLQSPGPARSGNARSFILSLSVSMPLAEFTALLALASAMSFTPGPNTALSTAMAANRGLRPAMRFVCAVPVGWALLLLLCAGGVGAVVVAVPALRWAIKAVGIGYLLWLAWTLSQSARLGEADAARMDIGFWQGAALGAVTATIASYPGWRARMAAIEDYGQTPTGFVEDAMVLTGAVAILAAMRPDRDR